MTSPVTLDPNVHTRVPSSVQTDDNQIISSLKALAGQIPTLILNEVVAVIKQETGIDLSGAATLIENLGSDLGFDLNGLSSYFQGIDLTQPGSIVAAIEKAIQGLVNGLIQKVIDAITNGLNNSASTGNDPLAILFGFLNPVNDINNIKNSLLTISNNLQAMIAGVQGQVTVANSNIATIASATTTAINSGGDDFNRTTLGSTWTNVAGTLGIQNFTGDGYLRTSGFAAGYYNVAHPGTDKHGAQVRLTAKAAGGTRLYICSDTALSNFVAVDIYCDPFGNDAIGLATGSSPNVVVTHTSKPYSFFGLQDNCVIDLKYDPVANTYYVFKDAAASGTPPILTWTDTNNIITHGASKRICAVATNTGNNIFQYGFGITDYKYYDWS